MEARLGAVRPKMGRQVRSCTALNHGRVVARALVRIAKDGTVERLDAKGSTSGIECIKAKLAESYPGLIPGKPKGVTKPKGDTEPPPRRANTLSEPGMPPISETRQRQDRIPRAPRVPKE